MRLLENYYPVPPLQNRHSLENFIDQSLLGDWIIRVEYSGNNSQGQKAWAQWGSTMFAVKSPDEVMQAIDACHANYPAKEIRLYAEKVRPETRMIYSVYRSSESVLEDEVCVNVAPVAAHHPWWQTSDSYIPAKGNATWRYLAAACTLVGTLIVWEAASS